MDDWLKENISKIDQKVDNLDQKLDVLTLKTEKNTIVLEEHQRRSLANEATVTLVRQELQNRIQPLERYKDSINTVFRLIGIISVIIGMLAGIIEIIHFS